MMHQWLPLKGYIPTPTPEPGNMALLEKRVSEEVIKLRTRGRVGVGPSVTDRSSHQRGGSGGLANGSADRVQAVHV